MTEPITSLVLEKLRDRLAAATGDKPPRDAKLGAKLKTALGQADVEGDPTCDVLVAIELCDACGLKHLAQRNDMEFIQHRGRDEPSGFHITTSRVTETVRIEATVDDASGEPSGTIRLAQEARWHGDLGVVDAKTGQRFTRLARSRREWRADEAMRKSTVDPAVLAERLKVMNVSLAEWEKLKDEPGPPMPPLPADGEYTVDLGTYGFGAGDVGRTVEVSYGIEHAALAICRGIVAELWLAHPDRRAVIAEPAHP